MKSEVIESLRNQLGSDRVETSDEALDARRFDYSVLSHLQDWRGEALPRAGVIVRPESTAEVQSIMRIASATQTPVSWRL